MLLADEPTGDLDEQNAWAVFELLERLHRTHRLTSLIATHNLALAERCDRVVGLEHGVLQDSQRAKRCGEDPRGRIELIVFERYTEKARRVIFFARYEASQYGSPYIETEHLLLGLMREDKALANRFLRQQGSIESIRKEIEARITIRERISTSVEVPLSAECKRILNSAAEEAERLGAQARGHGAFAVGNSARREVLWRGDSDGARAAAVGVARGTFADERREKCHGAAERNVVADGIQPRPDASGHGRQPGSAGGTRRGSRARDSDFVPAHEKQSRC